MSVNWTVYTDDTDVARVYRGADDGLVYIQAKGCGATSIYISHVYKENWEDVDPEHLYKVCDVDVVARKYRALIFGTGTGVENENGEDAGITFTRSLKSQFENNVYPNEDIEIITSYSGNEAKLMSMINEFAQNGTVPAWEKRIDNGYILWYIFTIKGRSRQLYIKEDYTDESKISPPHSFTILTRNFEPLTGPRRYCRKKRRLCEPNFATSHIHCY